MEGSQSGTGPEGPPEVEQAGAAEVEQRAPAAPPAERTAPPAQKPRRGSRGVGVWTSVIVALLTATAFLVFVVQNTETVHVDWTVWAVDVSLAAVVFGAMLLGSALTLALGAIWRIRRRRHQRDRDELHRLRGGTG